MKRRLAIVFALCTALLVSTLAFADTGTGPLTVVITEGALAPTTVETVDFGSRVYSSNPATYPGSRTALLWITDGRSPAGVALGFHVDFSASNFTSGPNTCVLGIAAGNCALNFSTVNGGWQQTDTSGNPIGGGDMTSACIPGPCVINATALKVGSHAAVDTVGNDQFKLNVATWSLLWPGGKAAGSYTSTLTQAIVSGP